MLLERVFESPQRHDARTTLAGESAFGLAFRLLHDFLVQLASLAVRVGPLVRRSECLLVPEVVRLQERCFLVGGHRVCGQVVLDVDVPQGSQRFRARLNQGQNPLPGLPRERGVAILKVTVAQINEVAGISRRIARGQPLQDLQ